MSDNLTDNDYLDNEPPLIDFHADPIPEASPSSPHSPTLILSIRDRANQRGSVPLMFLPVPSTYQTVGEKAD